MRDYSARLNTSPSSSPGNAAVTGIHTYVSPWRRWARITGALTAITSVIFSCLAVASYSNFNNLVSDISALPGEGDPLGVPTDVWTSLFAGAAASAVFAVVLTILNITLSTFLLCCARQSVAHPNRTLSKSFLVASCWFAMLHIANISSQFYSFLPLMGVLTSNLAVSFNRTLLTTTVVFGLLDTLFYLLFGLVLVPWVERPDLLQVDMSPSPSPRV